MTNFKNLKLITVCWIIIGILSISAVSASDTGIGALNIPVGAKQSALGGQGVTVLNDNFSFMHNPGLLPLEQNSAGFNYKQWFAGINIFQAAGNYKVEGIGSFGLGMMYSGVTFDEYDITGATVGQLNPSDTIVQTGYGRQLVENLSAGASFVFVSDSLDEQSTTVFAVNLGALYRIKFGSEENGYALDLGLSIRNLGTSGEYEDYSASLPMNVLGGANLHLPFFNLFIPVEAGLKAGEFDLTAGLGGGYKLGNIGVVNGYFGLPVTDDVRQFTAGLDISYNITDKNMIKASFTYEMVNIENVMNAGIGFYF